MEDEELARIRQQRLAQLQAGQQAGKSQGGDGANQEQMRERQAKEAEMRNNILSSVLTQDARARLANIAIAKPDRSTMIENIIIQNARMGALRGKVDEENLKNLLHQVTDKTKKETKVTYQRRYDDDDDSDV